MSSHTYFRDVVCDLIPSLRMYVILPTLGNDIYDHVPTLRIFCVISPTRNELAVLEVIL